MILFGNEAKEKVKGRAAELKSLAEKLKADYDYGIGSVVKRFYIWPDSDMSECNVISGNYEGYEYCFLEYYHVKDAKVDTSKWVSKLYVKTKYGNVPDFSLMTKTTATEQAGCGIVTSLPFIIIPLIIWIPYFTTSHKNYSNASFNVVSFFSVLFILVGLFGIYSNISSLKSANSKNQYGITDDVFNEKYYIDSIAEPEVIRNIFTDEICSKIVNEIEDMEISFINNCVSEEFGPNIQLSVSTCNVHLQKLIRKVKMFDREGCV